MHVRFSERASDISRISASKMVAEDLWDFVLLFVDVTLGVSYASILRWIVVLFPFRFLKSDQFGYLCWFRYENSARSPRGTWSENILYSLSSQVFLDHWTSLFIAAPFFSPFCICNGVFWCHFSNFGTWKPNLICFMHITINVTFPFPCELLNANFCTFASHFNKICFPNAWENNLSPQFYKWLFFPCLLFCSLRTVSVRTDALVGVLFLYAYLLMQ